MTAQVVCERHRCTHISLNSDSTFATLKRDPTVAVDIAGATSPAFAFEESADKLAQLVKMTNSDHGSVKKVGQTFVWELGAKASWKAGTSQCDRDGVQSVSADCNGYQCFIGKCLFDGDGTKPLEAATRDCPVWDSSLENSVMAKRGKNLQFAEYDRCNFYSTGYGVPYVSRDRWRKAQSFEAGYHVGKTEDRQDVHTTWFRNYASIYGVQLGNVLEIGSGAFSQTKEVLDIALAKSVTLVDPLMSHYVQNVEGCNYKSGRLLNKYTTLLVQAGGEDVDFKESFDTVIMMNVLEHCINAIQVLQNMHNAVIPGGLLIFSERWYDTKWDRYDTGEWKPFWDVGHPISIKKQVITHLLRFYEPIYEQGFHFEDPFFNDDEGVYFIGRKKVI
jgi:SAM-dependent methyltransferase